MKTTPSTVGPANGPTPQAGKTLSGWLNDVVAAGLVLEAICEPPAGKPPLRRTPEVAGTRIAPFLLIVRARQP